MSADFSTRNPLLVSFWDERFAKNYTPWEQGGVPQALQQFIEQQSTTGYCLIPGCGSATEVAYLAHAGWRVTAIDFSEAAITKAKDNLGELGKNVVQADFFQYQPPHAVTMIYERAFFCALPPTMRTAIVKRWASLLSNGGLLAGFFYLDEHDAESSNKTSTGPPFIITFAEFAKLMEEDFICLANEAVEDSNPIFLGKERWQVWQRR
jgi:trans-aconitate methyltransferase